MQFLDALFSTIGAAIVFWWLTGVVMLAFSKSYIGKGTPLSIKFYAVLTSGFLMPYAFLKTGHIPALILHEADPDPEEEARVKAFMQSFCKCPECRARRGE
jgi:hypothetical protein